MAHTLFLLHGMGTFTDGTNGTPNWADPIKEGIEQIYSQKDGNGKLRYPLMAGLNFGTRFNVVPIHYSRIFSEILERWKQDSGELGIDVADNEATPGFFESLTGLLQGAADQDSFFWTHAFDAILYRLSPWVRKQVTTHVALQLARGIHAVSGGHGNWSAIGHSLGTAVLHDSLHRLFVGQMPDGTPAGFDPTQAQAKAIIMVSNVSRVLQTVPGVLSDQSTIRPGYAGQPDRGCRRYVTVRNEFDPFTWVKTFDPAVWPDEATMAAKRYVPIRVGHLQAKNPHDVLHYLRNPEVHVPIFRALDHDYVITDEQAKDAFDDFEYYGTFSQADWVKIRQTIEDLKQLNGLDNTWKAIKVLKEAWDELQDSWDQILEDGNAGNGEN